MEKIFVAMSGGLDSTAAALLLREQGCAVEGVTFRLFPGADAVSRAASICKKIGIPHHVMELEAPFEREVIGSFIAEYGRGRTPNPCVLCNRVIKFGAFYDFAMAQGADAVATGHYARVAEADGRLRIMRAADHKKDQSYVLYTLAAHKLPHLRFPLCDLSKEKVRALVAGAGVAITGGESQDICFIPDGDYGAYLTERGTCGTAGDFIGPDGRIIGRHKGVIHYTVGQRKGLGLALPEPAYVNRIDAGTNRVYLGDNASLFQTGLRAGDVCLTYPGDLETPRRVTARIRYNHRGAPAVAALLPGGDLSVRFDEPQRAITPGQSVVLYDGDIVLGGGLIAGADQ